MELTYALIGVNFFLVVSLLIALRVNRNLKRELPESKKMREFYQGLSKNNKKALFKSFNNN